MHSLLLFIIIYYPFVPIHSTFISESNFIHYMDFQISLFVVNCNCSTFTTFCWIMIITYIVSWEPEGRYCSSKMFRWDPEGRYCCIKSMAIAPFWFSMEHLWTAIAPLWLSTDDIYLYDIYLRMLGWKQTKTKTIININFRLSKDKSIVNCERILFLHCM